MFDVKIKNRMEGRHEGIQIDQSESIARDDMLSEIRSTSTNLNLI
jgi:hypothetical protein